MRHLLLVIVLAACGGKKEENATATPEAAKPADPTPPVAKTEPPAVQVPKADDFAHGYCRVVGSGAVTFDQKMPHTGGSMLNVYQWHTEDMRSKMGFKPEGMTLNCLGDGVRLNVIAAGAFPTKPAKYTFGKKGELKLMGTIKHADERNGLSIMGADGSLDITAFDDKHIAGKGEVTVKTLPDKGEIKLALEFDMQCYGLSGCVK